MKYAKEMIFTPFRCTRRVLLTFPHFITETGKQTLRVSFCFSFKVLNDSEKSVSRSVLLLSTYMMLEWFGDNLTVTTSDISKLTHFPPEYYVSLLLYNPIVVYQKQQLLESLLSD